MTTSQQQADAALQKWQEFRRQGLTPDERIEILMREFFADPLASEVEYQAVCRRVAEEMSA
jgi:hypothetical protein